MPVAFFDLDHTLLAGDSDQLWGDFLRARGEVGDEFQSQKNAFFAAYQAGNLDIAAFQRFMLATVKGRSETQLQPRLREFAFEKIAPLVRPQGRAQWQWHQQQGHPTVIITATNRLLASAILFVLDDATLIATEPELHGDIITGDLIGTPSFRDGKIIRAQAYCQQRHADLYDSYFYSDSHNDLPLLQTVRWPRAVTPDARLRAHAEQQHWPILSW